eukprot:m.82082 g.82082  ORF g.82082 m.82082 type:complete len:88 (-) comp14713_c0_seq3:833-1096(-)
MPAQRTEMVVSAPSATPVVPAASAWDTLAQSCCSASCLCLRKQGIQPVSLRVRKQQPSIGGVLEGTVDRYLGPRVFYKGKHRLQCVQ